MVASLKKIFLDEGFFSIRVTSLGPKLCILKDLVLGELEAFVKEKRSLWERWFFSLRPWNAKDVDTDRLTWLHIKGIPCHAWGLKFFNLIANVKGTFVECDEATLSRVSMEEARVCIQTSCKNLINDVAEVSIDGIMFPISFCEDPSFSKVLVDRRINKDMKFFLTNMIPRKWIPLQKRREKGRSEETVIGRRRRKVHAITCQRSVALIEAEKVVRPQIIVSNLSPLRVILHA